MKKFEKKLHKDNDIAISISNVSKEFRIPHEKVTSLRGAAVSVFKKQTYEEFKALDKVSFEVKKGEFFGIIGRNGSGKSTLLKTIAGIYQADKGKIKTNGRISPFLELGIGFNPDLSGRDNVYLNATVLGMSKKEIDAKFDTIVKFAELERFIDQKLKNYSSGMQVRLAFSVSIHANRDILLMDEVLAVGDANFQKKCIDIFRNYRSHGKTVILVTHDMTSVRKYCNRAMLLHNGKIAKIGDVDEVCDEYVVKNMTAEAHKELKDSEKSVNDENDRENALRAELKNKSQVILDVRVYDSEYKELLSTERGQNFIVEVDVELKKVIENVHLAVQLYDKETGCFVSGNNTYTDGFKYNWKNGVNRVVLQFIDHQLNHGNFYVKAILFEYNINGNENLDELSTLEKNYFFIAKRKNAGLGTTYLNHKWSDKIT